MSRNKEITFAGNFVNILGDKVNVGDKGQDFTLLKNDLSEVSLKDFEGKVKIISVVPSIDTGVCAAQTRKFNVTATELEDVYVLTVSVDLPFALDRFCGAEGIDKAITLSDHRALDFGLKYGFAIEGLRLLTRGIVVLDKDNTIKHIEYVKEITDHPDYDAALTAVKELV